MFAIAVTVILLLLPFANVVVWDGNFSLTMTINSNQQVDDHELSFAT